MRVERIGGAWKINGVYYDPESVVHLASERDTLRTRLAEVEAENGRLRAALTEIYADTDNHWALQQPRSVVAGIKERVRAALAQTTEKDHDDDT